MKYPAIKPFPPDIQETLIIRPLGATLNGRPIDFSKPLKSELKKKEKSNEGIKQVRTP